MRETNSKLLQFTIVFLVASALVYLIEYFIPSGKGGSLLFNLLFWVSIIEGAIAVVAAAEVTNGKWIAPYKHDLLGVYPLLLLVTFLFVAFIPRIEFYPWIHEPGIWLNKNLFIIRCILFLLAAFYSAHLFARETLRGGPKKRFYAVIYLFVYVISQTSVAFDWVMSLNYPWYSTLFGGYFFIEAFYTGLALGGILTYVYFQRYQQIEGFPKAQMDMATLLFAFSVFWGSQFYTQYLVIWYGNLPEEVSLIVHRISHSPTREFSYLIIVLLFVVPFLTLISRKLKANPRFLLFISLVVWLGIAIERLVLIGPVLTVHPIPLIIEFALVGGLFLWVFRQRDQFLVTPET